jgi:GNAT superfamily N-acetyltransferase
MNKILELYDHDKPANIEACLKQEGFMPNPKGTLMVLPLNDDICTQTGHDICRVTSADRVHDYLSVAKAAFGSVEEGQFDYLTELMSAPDFALFCGYADGEPAVSGLLQMPAGTSFGLLYGGGVSPAHRSKGFYKAAVAARVSVARERGMKYLATEARETSRPILESLGFIPLVKETTWMLPKV